MTRLEPNPFSHWIDLAQARLGTRVVSVTDEFFGAVERLLQPTEPVFVVDKYDEHGKWMDGWESRRRRGPGHDHCVLCLGSPGIVRGVDIDTRFFTGNFPPEASLEGCHCPGREEPDEGERWRTLLDRVALRGDSHNYFEVSDSGPVSHLRLNIYPDGGVARLRVYGEVYCEPGLFADGRRVDLFALGAGGRALACSDEHYGSMHNLNLPGRGIHMGDGWETARRRGPGHDWVVLRLGVAGLVDEIEIDTAHFKGNYPDRASIDGLLLARPPADPREIAAPRDDWQPVLPEAKLAADSVHRYAAEITSRGPFTHMRLNIYPDGGVSRLRIYGRPA